MSRYTIPTDRDDLEIVVGFDPPLETFFGQVFNLKATDDEEECLFWEGGMPTPITSLEELGRLMRPYATIPQEIQRTLLAEQQASTEPTPLQRMMRHLVESVRQQG